MFSTSRILKHVQKRSSNGSLSKRGFSIKSGIKTMSKLVVATTITTGLTVAGIYYLYTPRFSMSFIGKPQEFNKEVEKQFNLPPVEEFYPLLLTANFRGVLGLSNENEISMLESKYPKLWVSHALRATNHLNSNNKESFEKELKEIQRIAEQFPEENKLFNELIGVPSSIDDFIPDFKPVWTPVVEDKVWSYHSFNKALSEDARILTNTTVVRLKDGTIFIANPTTFDKEAVDEINKLGKVSALFTSTKAHCAALELATVIWPEAKVYGTDTLSKHDRPHLQWNFLTEENQKVFDDDFRFYPIKGHMFNEGLLYHNDSKSLIGITDLMLPGSEIRRSASGCPKNIPEQIYYLSVGEINTSGSSRRKTVSQVYHYAGCYDKKMMKESIEKILKLDVDHMPLGHGGVLNKEESKHELKEGFDWVLNPTNQYSFFEQKIIPLYWGYKSGFISMILEASSKRTK
eukprot:TRINITY_DN942_c1_g1_i2.p1 TRINITY_DN942_c1_g1~~TRINITY_DN942_c1_g1_i2.p1  ORF type:complete len:460 (+),score=103.88 TRINITY_DN942_c1_g1_i2:645-2024(+)